MKSNYVSFMVISVGILMLILVMLWICISYLISVAWVVWIFLNIGIEMLPSQKWAEYFSPIGQLITIIFLLVSLFPSIRFANKIWNEEEEENNLLKSVIDSKDYKEEKEIN